MALDYRQIRIGGCASLASSSSIAQAQALTASPQTRTRTRGTAKPAHACWQCAAQAATRQLHAPLLVLPSQRREDGVHGAARAPHEPQITCFAAERPPAPCGASSGPEPSTSSPATGDAAAADGGGGSERGGAAEPAAGVARRGGGEGGWEEDEDESQYSLGVRLALKGLGFYRRVMSPLMLSRCRFFPSCSKYSIQAFKEFGVLRGGVLTAWRLTRCQPWGGEAWSYDPPAWPPVGLEFMYGPNYVLWLIATNLSVITAAVVLHERGWL